MNAPTTTINQPIVISQYERLTNDIIIAEQKSESASFNYRDAKENKLARSHVYGLRTLKGQIESARKEAKAYALDYGRRVDTAARELSDRVEKLILPHETEIKKIEAEEADRKAKHQAVIDGIINTRKTMVGESSVSIALALAGIKETDTTGMEEYKAQADAEILETIKALDDALIVAVKREQEAAELTRLRKEAAEREEKERVERIKREAVEAEQVRTRFLKMKAEQEAKEEQARKDRAAKEKVERAKLAEQQAKIDAERAELRAKEAEARAAEMAKREKERAAQVEREIAEAEARRQERDRKERENRDAVIKKISSDLKAAMDDVDSLEFCATPEIRMEASRYIAERIIANDIAHVRVDWEA